MRICLYIDPSRVFRWHCWLAEALSAVPDYRVAVRFATRPRSLPRACMLLFDLERLIYGLHGNALDPAPDQIATAIGAPGDSEEPFDTVIDLAGSEESPPPAYRLLSPSFNGIPGEIGALAGLVNKEAALIEVHDSAATGSRRIARPALSDPDVFLRSLDEILSCAVALIRSTLQDKPQSVASLPHLVASASGKRSPHAPTPPFIGGTALLHASISVARKSLRLAELLATGGKAWAVAWRRAPAYALLDQRQAEFSIVPEDGSRYYADPFPFCWRGRTFLFVEEFPYATSRGCISVIEIDETGVAGSPRPIVEESYHLSYPFVFDHDGDIWMIPECGEANGIYLYRAESFPYKWRRESCLVDGIAAYDTTLLRHGGQFWLFVCERLWNSSSWDILNLFHAATLTGEWLPHRRNPVLFDGALSRPGGAVFTHQGHHLRPVQDCTKQYGGALSLCRIETLGENEFSQVPFGRIHCGPHGCHTYNHAGIEVIDVFSKRGLGTVTAFFSPTGASELGFAAPAAHPLLAGRAPADDLAVISNNTEPINYAETAHAGHSDLKV
jgi:hypothetical protein